MTSGEQQPGTPSEPGGLTADDLFTDAEREALVDLLERELGQSPMVRETAELVPLVVEAGLVSAEAEAWATSGEPETPGSAEAMVEEEIRAIARNLDLIWEHEGAVALLSRLLEGRVFTHRLSAREAEDEAIEVAADLCLVDYGGFERLLADGTVVSIDVDWSTGLAWLHGPAGWLEGWGPGDLVGFRRTGTRMQLERVEVAEAGGEAEAAAVVAQLQETLDLGYGDEANNPLLNALLADARADAGAGDGAGSLFRQPVPPVSELLTGAGLSTDGLCFGPAGRIWQRRFGAGAIRDVLADRYGLDECCLAALDTVNTGWRAHVLGMEANPEAPALADVVTALNHGDVAAAFADQVSFPYDRASVGGWVDHLVAGAEPGAIGPHLLAGCLAEQHDELGPAEEHYRAVVAVEPHPMAVLALVDLAIDRSDFAGALQLLSRLDDPENPDIDYCRYLSSFLLDPRRNDPCPCGSGRKYKACHDPQPFTDPDRRLTILCRKLARFAAQYGSMVEEMADQAAAVGLPFATALEVPLLRDSWLADKAVAARYRTRRGELLPADEAALLDQLVSGVPLRVLEIEPGGRPPAARAKDLVTGERLSVVPPDSDAHLRAGEVILARVLGNHIFGGYQTLDSDARRSAALALLAAGQPDIGDLLAWFADTFGSTAEPSTSINF